MLRKRGFTRVDFSVPGAGVYFRYTCTGDVEKYLSFRYQSYLRSYEITLGAELTGMREALKPHLEISATGPYPVSEMLDRARWPCLSMFRVVTFLGWPYTGAPIGTQGDLESIVEKVMRDAFFPLLADVNDAEALASMLAREDAPFQWGGTGGTYGRIAQLAYLAHKIGRAQEFFFPVVQRNAFFMNSDPYCKGCNESVYVQLHQKLAATVQ